MKTQDRYLQFVSWSEDDQAYVGYRQPQSAYTTHFVAKNTGLRAEIAIPWNESDETTIA